MRRELDGLSLVAEAVGAAGPRIPDRTALEPGSGQSRADVVPTHSEQPLDFRIGMPRVPQCNNLGSPVGDDSFDPAAP